MKNRPGTTLSLSMPQKALELRLIKADIREESLGRYFCALFIYPDQSLWKNRLHLPWRNRLAGFLPLSTPHLSPGKESPKRFKTAYRHRFQLNDSMFAIFPDEGKVMALRI